MVRNSEKFGLTLLLALCLSNVSVNEAFANNTLNQVDISRHDSDKLEFTLYTSSPYADNVVVTKKSDNKYVILMPNVNQAANTKPDFSSVRDIVTDVNVRAIDDGQSGYTKVTVITNRPVSIKTNTAKVAPVTKEQREYRALIAQQKVKPQQQVNYQTNNTSEAIKTPAFKLPEIQPTKTAADIIANSQKSAQKVTKQVSSNVQNKVKEISNKTANARNDISKIAQVKNQKSNIQKEQQKIEKQIKNIVPTQTKLIDKEEIKDVSTKNVEATVLPPAPKVAETPSTTNVTNTKDKANNSLEVSAILASIKNQISNLMKNEKTMTYALVLIPIICLIALLNLIKASLQKSQMLKRNFFDNLSRNNYQKAPSEYDNIINNENLSWQEKYQQYVDVAGENEEPQDPQKPQYKFIANNKQETAIKEETQAEKLGRILQSSPSLEKTEIENDIEDMESVSYLQDALDETDLIHDEITKTVHLKAFAEKPVLEETRRNKKIKHRRVKLEIPTQEVPHVNLGFSQLHSNPRALKDATLSISDLIAKSDRLLNIKPENTTNNNDYEMVSVDDYLDIIDNDIENVTSSLSDKVAESLGTVSEKPVVEMSKKATNPIEALRNETRENYLSGLIVKSGYDIDEKRGFYHVSLDGKSAIIGKIEDEVFVLKKFDRNINKPLQVRQDNPNVYMVKADEFKSLVEVQKDKMGVLIEL